MGDRVWCDECFVCEYRHWPMRDRVWCDECCLWIQTLTNGRPCLMWRVLSVNMTLTNGRPCLMWRVLSVNTDTDQWEYRVWCDECCLWIQTLTNDEIRVWCDECCSVNTDTDQWETVSDVTSVVCEYRHWPMWDRVWVVYVVWLLCE